MLSEDIDDINEMVGVVPECEPYRESWQRIKTALAELGTTPNSAMNAIADLNYALTYSGIPDPARMLIIRARDAVAGLQQHQ